jgi:hypothetical protein
MGERLHRATSKTDCDGVTGGRRVNIDISTLFPDLEALSPDGRWSMLQKWLKENPEYDENVDRWSQMSVDAVCDEIAILVIGKYGGIAVFVLQSEVGKVIKEKVRRLVEILQACYRERAGHQTEKEIKNVRRKRVPTRTAKRANQDQD